MITAKSFTMDELNFYSDTFEKMPELRFYDVRTTPEFRIYGVMDSADGKAFVRMPEDIAAKVSDGVTTLNRHPSGGRIRFVTTSKYVAIKTTAPTTFLDSNAALLMSAGFDFYVRKNGKEIFSGVIMPGSVDSPEGFHGMVNLPEGEKEITINLPLFRRVQGLYIGLDSTATLSKRGDYKYERPVLYYGSSITQGGCASRPGMAYEAIISRMLDTNYTCLGFSGNAKGEDAMIEYLSTLDCSVFVLDYDHNAPNEEHLAATHEKLYLRFRETHPDTPVVIAVMPNFKSEFHPIVRRRKIIYNTYLNARARGEKVLFVDDYHIDDEYLCSEWSVDGVHPNDLGMAYMAKYIGRAVEVALGM